MDKDEAKRRVRETVGRAKEVLAQGKADSLPEAAIREVFVTPSLVALGWNPLQDIAYEYHPKLSRAEAVDYALLLEGQPIAFVEAKRLALPLTDEMAAQVIRYAAVEGVQWCVLTNGANWKLYDQFLKGDIHAKLVVSFDLTAFGAETEFDSLFEKLWFMSQDSLSNPSALKRWVTLERLDYCLRTWLADPASAAVEFLQGELARAEIDVSAEEIARWFERQTERKPSPPRPPPLSPPPTADYWLFPGRGRPGVDSVTLLHEWLDRSMWGFWETTRGRRQLKAGDRACFYAKGVGIVAHATIAGPGNTVVSAEEWPETEPPTQKVYKIPLGEVQWLPQPVKLSEALRVKLDAFAGKDPTAIWSWFVQTTFRLTVHDFGLLTAGQD